MQLPFQLRLLAPFGRSAVEAQLRLLAPFGRSAVEAQFLQSAHRCSSMFGRAHASCAAIASGRLASGAVLQRQPSMGAEGIEPTRASVATDLQSVPSPYRSTRPDSHL